MMRRATKSPTFLWIALGGIGLLALLTLFPIATASFAQSSTPSNQPEACSELVELAIKTTSDYCLNSTGRNQACYGNRMVSAEAQPDAQLVFNEVGSKADLVALKALDLGGLDMETQEWGVALMQVQANLPNTLPGQNVTFLLFGDVQIENDSLNLAKYPMTTSQGVNVRLTPSQDSILLGSLRPGMRIDAVGQHTQPDGTRWVQFVYDAHPGLTGWVISDGLQGDITPLPEVNEESQIYNPMQAIYFTTGVGKPLCVDAPQDGIVIQSPKGVGLVDFTLNGVRVEMGSTAYVQAIPGDALYYTLLEGSAFIEAANVIQQVLPGQTTRIPLDANGRAAAAPSFPQPYNPDTLQPVLKLLGILPRPIRQLPAPVTITPRPTQPPALLPTATQQLAMSSLFETQSTPTGNPPTDEATPSLCAYQETQLVSVKFVNKNTAPTDASYDVYLQKNNCKEKFLTTLAPGNFETFVTHVSRVWVIRDHATQNIIKTWVATEAGNFVVDLP